jgi:hypothetical protein
MNMYFYEDIDFHLANVGTRVVICCTFLTYGHWFLILGRVKGFPVNSW